MAIFAFCTCAISITMKIAKSTTTAGWMKRKEERESERKKKKKKTPGFSMACNFKLAVNMRPLAAITNSLILNSTFSHFVLCLIDVVCTFTVTRCRAVIRWHWNVWYEPKETTLSRPILNSIYVCNFGFSLIFPVNFFALHSSFSFSNICSLSELSFASVNKRINYVGRTDRIYAFSQFFFRLSREFISFSI